MNIVDTPSQNKTQVKRKPDGKPDYNAYVGLEGEITENGLTVKVNVTGARARYGHLDLQVTPQAGSGTRWVERKNIVLPRDPAASPAVAPAVSPYIEQVMKRNAEINF